MYNLENAALKITVSQHGAELHSITGKKEGTEYLWNGDAKYWRYHAPILFPIVGKVVDSVYRVDGREYQLPAHGIGRISDFTKVAQAQDSITFELKYSDESLAVYPYRFSLQVSYTLIQNTVKVGWKVSNLDQQAIYFSIGAHPAFMCPIDPNDTVEDCYLEFSKTENAQIIAITPECYLSRTKQAYLKNAKTLPLSSATFKDGVLVFDELQSDAITIKSKKNAKSLSVKAAGFPYWGIWAPETGAPFLCLEPWYGHADYADFTGEFKDKAGNHRLEVGGVFSCCYEIEIGQ